MANVGRKLCLTILAAILALAGNSVAWAQSAVVETTGGKIEGVQQAVVGGPGVISFKGVPYAAPPIGALRWKKTTDCGDMGRGSQSGCIWGGLHSNARIICGKWWRSGSPQ